ncbi:MAG: chorismate mutase [Thermosediminibacterales bacterium]|nr:chorismate mutase [Thermosediminibacterales bacterium]MDK2836093.1 chorismate mutase [Thermosediminibacterales bacterium]
MDDTTTYYIIKAEVLPEILKKTLKAKRLLKKGKAATINEAVKMAGMSRSAFYKYKDSIFPFFEVSRGKIITLALTLEDQPGVLSNILDNIARAKGNVLTINQNIPIQGIANVTISIRTAGMQESGEELIKSIQKIEGVQNVDILAQE